MFKSNKPPLPSYSAPICWLLLQESKILSMKLAKPLGSSSVDGQAWSDVAEAGYLPELGTLRCPTQV